MEFKSLNVAFNEAVTRYGDKVAFRCMGVDYSYNKLDQMSRDFAAFLQSESGLRPGDRIAIQLPNAFQYPVATFGALRAGLVIVNTNPMYTVNELRHQLSDSGAKAVVVMDNFITNIETVLQDTNVNLVISTNLFDFIEEQPKPDVSIENLITLPQAILRGGELAYCEVAQSPDDVAVLQYTGGTTGVAKGAMLLQKNLCSSANQIIDSFSALIPDGAAMVVPMPIYHIYGFLAAMLVPVFGGKVSVLVADPRNIDDLIQTFKDNSPALFGGVSTLFIALMQHPEFETVDFSALQITLSGGAALAPEIAEQWIEKTDSEICEGYGLSESTGFATVNPPGETRIGTIGKLVNGTEMKLVGFDGHDIAPGQEGELLIRGPQIMQGYWKNEEATRAALSDDGWLSTGDVATIDDDGYLRIVDRLKEMIIVSGFNVYPNEIEAVVYTHPEIIECAVIGVSDDRTGEAVKLYAVTSDEGLSEESLREFCRANLAAYKIPKHVEFREELPKSNVGKILRRELR